MPYKWILILMLCALGVARASVLDVAHSEPESVFGETCGSAMPFDVPPARVLQAGGDEERGCCIIEAADGRKCVYASRGFCRMKADEAGVAHRFHANTSCSSVPQCQG
jgi:hypothetical protein